MFKGQTHIQNYIYDFAVDGGTVSTISLSAKDGAKELPAGAIVKTVYGVVLTAFTSGGSATLTWGNTSDIDGYSGATIAVASLTAGAVFNGWDNGAALLWDDTNDHAIYYRVNAANTLDFSVSIATAAMTAGKMEFVVEYYLPGVAL